VVSSLSARDRWGGVVAWGGRVRSGRMGFRLGAAGGTARVRVADDAVFQAQLSQASGFRDGADGCRIWCAYGDFISFAEAAGHAVRDSPRTDSNDGAGV